MFTLESVNAFVRNQGKIAKLIRWLKEQDLWPQRSPPNSLYEDGSTGQLFHPDYYAFTENLALLALDPSPAAERVRTSLCNIFGSVLRREWEAEHPGQECIEYRSFPVADATLSIQQALVQIQADLRQYREGRPFAVFFKENIEQYTLEKHNDKKLCPDTILFVLGDFVNSWYYGTDPANREARLDAVLQKVYSLPPVSQGNSRLRHIFGQFREMYQGDTITDMTTFTLRKAPHLQQHTRARYFILYHFSAMMGNRRHYHRKLLQFAMGSHTRLGASSLVRTVDNELLKLICSFV